MPLTTDWRAAWGRMRRLRVSSGGKYGVTLVRGPFVQLRANAEECRDEDSFLAYAAELREQGHRLAADLFSGAGGLSLGLEDAGYRVILGIDRDEEATETHRHHFGGLTVDWDLGKPERIAQVAHLVKAAGIELLAGGPPVPAVLAGRAEQNPAPSRQRLLRPLRRNAGTCGGPSSRSLPSPSLRPCSWRTCQTWRSTRTCSSCGRWSIELESIGYAVEERVVDTSQYGVPQFRQTADPRRSARRGPLHLASAAARPSDRVERHRRPALGRGRLAA